MTPRRCQIGGATFTQGQAVVGSYAAGSSQSAVASAALPIARPRRAPTSTPRRVRSAHANQAAMRAPTARQGEKPREARDAPRDSLTRSLAASSRTAARSRSSSVGGKYRAANLASSASPSSLIDSDSSANVSPRFGAKCGCCCSRSRPGVDRRPGVRQLADQGEPQLVRVHFAPPYRHLPASAATSTAPARRATRPCRRQLPGGRASGRRPARARLSSVS